MALSEKLSKEVKEGNYDNLPKYLHLVITDSAFNSEDDYDYIEYTPIRLCEEFDDEDGPEYECQLIDSIPIIELDEYYNVFETKQEALEYIITLFNKEKVNN